MHAETVFRAVAYPADGVWIAQGVDYDICVFAPQIVELPSKFMKSVADYVRIAEHLGRPPLTGMNTVPDRFKAMYDSADAQLAPLKPEPTKLGGVDMRVAVVPA